MQGCNSVKQLPNDKQLIVKESIEKNGKIISKDPVSLLSLTPVNKKILGIPFRLHLYNLSKDDPTQPFDQWLDKKPKRKERLSKWLSDKQVNQLRDYKLNFNAWLRKNGEAPSLVDSSKIALTNSLFEQYYNNLGYFNVRSTAKTDSIGEKKASIQYTIETGEVFTLDSISHVAGSKDIDSLYRAHLDKSFLKQGNPFVVEKFDNERSRLIDVFRNNGIYNFQQRSIRFKAFKDSLGIDTKIPVTVEIKNAQKRVQDTLKEVPYRIQKINSIAVYVENPEQAVSVYTDSIQAGNIKLFSIGKLKYNPKVLTDGIKIQLNSPYSYQERTATYRYFNELQNFKYPSIVYTPAQKDSTLLNAAVYLSPKERFSVGADFDVSHSNIQDIGISLGTSLISRNVFRGGEILEVGVKGTLGASRDVAEQKNSFFNLFEIGGNIRLRVPRVVAPKWIENLFFPNKEVKTSIALGVSLQENIGLDRQSFTGNFEYNWKSSSIYSFNFKLADIEFVENKAVQNYFNVYRNSYDRLNTIVKALPNNATYLNEEGNLGIPSEANTFIQDVINDETSLDPTNENYTRVSNINERKNRLTANNFIVGSSFTFLKNNQESIIDENFSQLRLKVEVVGNILNSILSISGAEVDSDGNRIIFNLAPSQYFKSEVNYIKHWQVGRERIFAFRGFTGIALPYGNSNSIPFTRSYYAGGSNDNRAWQAYKLGPGSSSGVNEFNEANFKVALNLEYRYPIIGAIKGAFFIDAGNIWNINNNVPDLEQSLNSLRDLNQLAVGTGFGIRYDFDYFVFRLDTAFKTFDPSLAKNQRWGSQVALKKAVFNVGINYPF
jgi:outer membrane protein assembly factor BamA